MTTICGIVQFNGSPVARADLDELLSRLATPPIQIVASPDGAVTFASLGATEPATSTSSRAILVSDCRIDNLEELSSKIPAPTPDWTGTADAAQILRATYESYGFSWPLRLRGAFAVAVWDSEARRLALIRDPMGERSLYWARNGSRVVFASEPIQVVAGARSMPRADVATLLAYLSRTHGIPTSSFFAGVQRVPEGHQCFITASDTSCSPYWNWSLVAAPSVSPSDSVDALSSTLQGAVKRRLSGPGHQGVLLSGGIDSISVAHFSALALAAKNRTLTAFTWTSRRGDAIDETALSRLFIRGRSNVQELPVPADDLSPFSLYPEAYSDPNGPSTSTYPDLLWRTLEVARSHGVRVLANGIGGDPVAGWLAPELSLLLRFRFSALAERWRGVPWRHRLLLREIRGAGRRRELPAAFTKRARTVARDHGLDAPAIQLKSLVRRDTRRRALIAGPGNALSLERFDRLHRRTGVRIVAPWHDRDVALLFLGLADRGFSDRPPAKALQRLALEGVAHPDILAAVKPKRSPSRLVGEGLLRKHASLVDVLLLDSRLEELGLVCGATLRESFREHQAKSLIPTGFWEILTAEIWLRTIAKL